MWQQIGITTNPNYKLLGKTVDGMITFGEVAKDNVISGIKLRVVNVGSPVPHYIQMDKDGDSITKGRQGTIVRCPGAFQVQSGDLVGAGIPGVFIDSGNGDLVLKSAGRIRIEAADIDILATGSGEKNGVINIEGNIYFCGVGKSGNIAKHCCDLLKCISFPSFFFDILN